MREGYEPQRYDPVQPHNPEAIHNTDVAFTIGDNNEAIGGETFEGNPEEATHWQRRDYSDAEDQGGDGRRKQKAVYGSFAEERDVWSER